MRLDYEKLSNIPCCLPRPAFNLLELLRLDITTFSIRVSRTGEGNFLKLFSNEKGKESISWVNRDKSCVVACQWLAPLIIGINWPTGASYRIYSCTVSMSIAARANDSSRSWSTRRTSHQLRHRRIRTRVRSLRIVNRIIFSPSVFIGENIREEEQKNEEAQEEEFLEEIQFSLSFVL